MNRKALILCLFLIVSVDCSAAMKKNKDLPKESTDLRYVVGQFHMKMRWGLWEQASAYVQDEYRSRFIGRYEEYGDDFKITELEIKSVRLESAEHSDVEVEQRWYHEPDMTVKKDRFMETWTMTDKGWRLKMRETKAMWRKKQDQKSSTAPVTAQNPVPEPSEN